MKRRQLLTLAGTAAFAGNGAVKIDCQSHLFSAEFLALLEKRTTAPYVYRKGSDRFVVVGQWHRKLMPSHTDVDAKLAAMDKSNIAMTALSINDPGPELFGKDSPAMSRLLNDFIADTVRKHPKRFFGLATLPFDSAKSMMDEFDRAINKLGMKGILLYSNLDGRFCDEEEFRPLFAVAERLGIPLLLHPAYPLTYDATKGRDMTGGLGLMFDTTIALGRIIMAGILEQHPKLKLVCPHVGGALPYLIGRVDHQATVLKRGAENIKRPPSEYLRNIWLDTVSPLAQAIRYGYDFVGPDRLIFASDHPWVDPELIVGEVAKMKLPAADEAKIFSGNARKLFNL
jgi:predicted TIM-barrel fold metal-dependent hydrolase